MAVFDLGRAARLLLGLHSGGRLTFSSLAIPQLPVGAGAADCAFAATFCWPWRSRRWRLHWLARASPIAKRGSKAGASPSCWSSISRTRDAALDLSLPDRERTCLDAVRRADRLCDPVAMASLGRADDPIGIVSFAAYADTRCPLTLDHDNLVAAAKQLEIVNRGTKTARRSATDWAWHWSGCAMPRPSRVSPSCFTDGVNNRGDTSPPQAAILPRRSASRFTPSVRAPMAWRQCA